MSDPRELKDISSWGCDIQGRDLARRSLASRRCFMKGGALALFGTSVMLEKEPMLGDLVATVFVDFNEPIRFQDDPLAGVEMLGLEFIEPRPGSELLQKKFGA